MLGWTIRFRFGGMESALSYLEQMAAKGWLLEYWQGNTLLFRHTEPKQLRFAMDIVPIGRWKLDGGRDNEKVREEYVAMYEEQGWHFVEHHERKFLFYTEDETVPMPQTDPVAYQDSVYRHHRNTTGGLVFLSILGAAFLQYMWHVLFLYVTTPIGIGLLQLVLVLVLCSCFGVLHNGIPMVREKRLLKKGQVPQIRGNEWWGRLMAACLVLALAGASRMAVRYMGKQAIVYLTIGVCFSLQWAIMNVGPWILYRLKALPMEQAKNMHTKPPESCRFAPRCCWYLVPIRMINPFGWNGHKVWSPWLRWKRYTGRKRLFQSKRTREVQLRSIITQEEVRSITSAIN